MLCARADKGQLVSDDELLPFEESTFDLVVSSCSLQWTNDIIGSLIQVVSISIFCAISRNTGQ